jgi:pilus assembly protein Flp/PilA
MKWLRKLRIDNDGATAVEYGLILALVVLAAMGAILRLADGTISMWNNVATEVSKS